MLQEFKKFRHKRDVEIFNFGDSYILFIWIHLPFYSFQIWNQLERKKNPTIDSLVSLMGFLLRFNRKRYFSLMIYCFCVSWPAHELSVPKRFSHCFSNSPYNKLKTKRTVITKHINILLTETHVLSFRPPL